MITIVKFYFNIKELYNFHLRYLKKIDLGNDLLFSIIIPVYNLETLIEKTLNSILDQNFVDFEIILIDDSSTDKSYQVCKKYSANYDQIKLKQLTINSGPGIARNEGIKLAQGKYIFFLDGDDYISPEALFNAYEEIKKNNFPEIIHFNFIENFGNIKTYVPTSPFIDSGLKSTDDFLIKYSKFRTYGFFLWEFMFKKEVVLSFNFRKSKMGEDLDFVLKILINSKNIFDSNIYFCEHIERISGSLSTASGHMKYWLDILKSSIEVIKLTENKKLSSLKKQWIVRNFEMIMDQFQEIIPIIKDRDIDKNINNIKIISKYLKNYKNLNNDFLNYLISGENAVEDFKKYRDKKLDEIYKLTLGLKNKNILIFPANRRSTRLSAILKNLNYNVIGLIDNNPEKEDLIFDGTKIVYAKKFFLDFKPAKHFIIVYAATPKTRKILCDQLKEYNLSQNLNFSSE